MVGIEEVIADKEYLGRGILVGKTLEHDDFVVYFVTGRSESSRARKFKFENRGVFEGTAIKTEPIDPETLKKGNPSLLIYNAIRRYQNMLIVSNGAQTDLIYTTAMKMAESNRRKISSLFVLTESFKFPYDLEGIDLASFEPDVPNYTPRISGFLDFRGVAALSIIRNDGRNKPERNYFEFKLSPGVARFISTYTGKNVAKGEVLPAFRGEPIEMAVPGVDLYEICKNIYDALGPKQGSRYLSPGQDFRVGVAVAYRVSSEAFFNTCIKNRCDLEEK